VGLTSPFFCDIIYLSSKNKGKKMNDFEAFVREIANQNPSAVSLGKWRDLIAKAQKVVESNPLPEKE
jgi:hypothetical protein